MFFTKIIRGSLWPLPLAHWWNLFDYVMPISDGVHLGKRVRVLQLPQYILIACGRQLIKNIPEMPHRMRHASHNDVKVFLTNPYAV